MILTSFITNRLAQMPALKMAVGHFLSLLLLLVSLPVPALTSELCLKFYYGTPHWLETFLQSGQILQSPASRIKHDPTRYFLGRSNKGPIKDQCNLGSCWAHGGLETFEYRARHRGTEVMLSPEFLVYKHLLSETLTAFSGRGEPVDFAFTNEGNTIRGMNNQIYMHGFIPRFAWVSGILNLSDRLAVDRFIIDLNLLVAHLRNDSQSVPKELANSILKNYIEKFLGHPKSTFDFEGKPITSEKFARLPLFAPLTTKRKILSERANLSTEKIFNLIVDQLKTTGEPVPISVKWVPSFIEKSTGIMSIRAFDRFNHAADNYHAKMTEIRDESNMGGHLMSVVDFDIDANGKPIKLLIKNSYGEKYGDQGYLHLYYDYFENYLHSVAVDAAD